MLPSILRLDVPSMRAIRGPVLAGDDLAVRQGGELSWLAPDGIEIVPAGGDRRRIVFRYRGDDGAVLTLPLGTFTTDAIATVLAIRERLSLAQTDRAWRPTLSRVGHIPEPDGRALTTVVPLAGPFIAAARRPVHPSYLMDRLMMRQRDLAADEIDALLATEPAQPARRSA
jgi:hypothetical protein